MSDQPRFSDLIAGAASTGAVAWSWVTLPGVVTVIATALAAIWYGIMIVESRTGKRIARAFRGLSKRLPPTDEPRSEDD